MSNEPFIDSYCDVTIYLQQERHVRHQYPKRVTHKVHFVKYCTHSMIRVGDLSYVLLHYQMFCCFVLT